MKKFIISLMFVSFGFIEFVSAQEKVLYDQDMGPETPINEGPRRHKVKWEDRDQNFDELPAEADWPARHLDPYPEEVILEIRD